MRRRFGSPSSNIPSTARSSVSNAGATSGLSREAGSYPSSEATSRRPGEIIFDTSDGVGVRGQVPDLQPSCARFHEGVDETVRRNGEIVMSVPASSITAQAFLRLLITIRRYKDDAQVEAVIDELYRSIRHIELIDTIKIYRLAKWAGCETIASVIRLRWTQASDRMDLLEAASSVDDIQVAKIAIARTPRFGTSASDVEEDAEREELGTDWWAKIGGLRPDWQLELTRLFWKSADQIPVQKTKGRKAKGIRRKSEVVLRRSHRSRQEIADLFDPK